MGLKFSTKNGLFFRVNILGNPLHPTEKVRNLGVLFAADYSFEYHVSNVCKNSFVQLSGLRHIRQYPTVYSAFFAALVSSQLN